MMTTMTNLEYASMTGCSAGRPLSSLLMFVHFVEITKIEKHFDGLTVAAIQSIFQQFNSPIIRSILSFENENKEKKKTTRKSELCFSLRANGPSIIKRAIELKNEVIFSIRGQFMSVHSLDVIFTVWAQRLLSNGLPFTWLALSPETLQRVPNASPDCHNRSLYRTKPSPFTLSDSAACSAWWLHRTDRRYVSQQLDSPEALQDVQCEAHLKNY